VLSHVAALAGRPEWMPGITATVALIIAFALLIAAQGPLGRVAWLSVAAAVVLGWRYAPSLLLYVPPAALNVAFGAYFVLTLAPGREPRIATFARLERGAELPPDLARYTRGLTWLWTMFFFGSAVVGVLLAAFAPLPVWSSFVNVASYVAVAALFVGEYLYRKLRFPHYRHAPLATLIRIVVQDRRSRAAGVPQR
jgi:uncharacterized membrane protein